MLAAFREWDVEGNGTISPAEFEQVMNQIAPGKFKARDVERIMTIDRVRQRNLYDQKRTCDSEN